MNHNIPRQNIEALRIVVDRLRGKSLNWVLIGSTSLAIQGVDIMAHDIDIMTDMESADKIADALKDFNIEPMNHKTSEQFRSYYGLFRINDLQVEVFADLEIKKDGEWTRTVRSRIKVIKRFEEMTLPLLELREEYEMYKTMGRIDKAGKIMEQIEKEENFARKITRAS